MPARAPGFGRVGLPPSSHRPNSSLADAPSFLHTYVLDLDRAELRAELQRRRLVARLGRPDGLAVDPVLDLVARHDEVEGVPLAFLDVLVLLVARDDVELGAAQEQVVVAL